MLGWTDGRNYANFEFTAFISHEYHHVWQMHRNKEYTASI
jgi:hypothetical protein